MLADCERLLEAPGILQSIQVYPKFLDEITPIPRNEYTIDAWGFEGFHNAFCDLLEKYPILVQFRRVVDIMCNIGTNSILASQKARNVVGLDIQPMMVCLARYTQRKLGIENVSFHVKDFMSYDFKNGDSIFILGNPLERREADKMTSSSIDYSRAIAFFQKLNALSNVVAVADLSEDPGFMYRNVLYTDVAAEILQNFHIRQDGRFMLYVKSL